MVKYVMYFFTLLEKFRTLDPPTHPQIILKASLGAFLYSIGNASNLVGKNQKLRSECCQSIFDMGLHSL